MVYKKLVRAQRTGIDMLVFDGDGTALCEKHAVPQSTIDAVQLLYEAGKFSTLCTGRCVQGALPIARRMNLRPLPLRHGPGILFGALNGGVIVDLEGRVIKEVRLGARRTAQVIEILQRRHLSIWLQTANDWFVLGGYDRCVQHEIDVLGTRPIYLNPNARLPLSETVKVAAVSWDPAALVGLSDSLKTFLGDGASVAQSHPKEVDGTHARANKGAFVRLVRRLTGIRRRHTATIGDMHNDLPMFLESEIAIAMGNAPAEVQARATHTAPRNSEGGFGWAVRHIVLPHR